MMVPRARVLGLCRQLLMVILINVPTVSLGLAMGWVSLASGEGAGAGSQAPAETQAEAGWSVVVAAATTFVASLVGVPLSARALAVGRKFAIIASSACFLVCWSLKLAGGGWWVVAARVAAGLGGAGAYSVAPLIAREMCEARVRGAASGALVPAHNVGFLLMYLAADFALPHRIVLWSCWGLSALHCGLFLMVPESPSFLAAQDRQKDAVESLAWLRGVQVDHPSLTEELQALPPPDQAHQNAFALFKDMVSIRARRRAFIISFVAIVGQEACGVYTLMQFAERAFVLARDDSVLLANSTEADGTWINGSLSATVSNMTVDVVSHVIPSRAVVEGTLLSPARLAVVLGAVQLVSSLVALYLVEKVGRRRLVVWSAAATGLALGGAAGAARGGAAGAAAGALGAAVAADNLGLQPAPYALQADMFSYQYRSCALMLSSAAASIANAVEVGIFPAVAAYGGLSAALLLAAILTAAYALFAVISIPETRNLSPEEIYKKLDSKYTVETIAKETKDDATSKELESDTSRV